MSKYVIDSDNNVTILEPGEDSNAADGTETFNSLEELAQLASYWPATRLVTIWNSLPGVVPVSKFTNRNVGVGRVWKALQQLSLAVAPHSPAVAPAQARRATRPGSNKKRASAAKATPPHPTKAEAGAREGSKKAVVLALLWRAGGATLGDLMTATGWQAHSVRGFLSGAVGKKMGLTVESMKRDDGERLYRLSK